MTNPFLIEEDESTRRVVFYGRILVGASLSDEEHQNLHGAINAICADAAVLKVVLDLTTVHKLSAEMVGIMLVVQDKLRCRHKQVEVLCGDAALEKIRTMGLHERFQIRTPSPSSLEQPV